MEVILSGYWQSLPPEHVKAGILADWADALEDWTQEQYLYALRKWRDEFPNKKPNPGHIKGMMLKIRGRREVERMRANQPPPNPEPVKQRVSDEARLEILKKAGFAPKRFGGVA